jgi:hypothetical protein
MQLEGEPIRMPEILVGWKDGQLVGCLNQAFLEARAHIDSALKSTGDILARADRDLQKIGAAIASSITVIARSKERLRRLNGGNN